MACCSLQPQSLVRRGQLLISFDVIDNWWDVELKERNKDKIVLGTVSLSKYISSLLIWICQGIFSLTLPTNRRGNSTGAC
jgi:hypothetical protein